MALRNRCQEIINIMQHDAMLRQNSPVETLMAFVQSELGRSADGSLEKTKSLILYFGNDADREEFLGLVKEAKPGMIARKLP